MFHVVFCFFSIMGVKVQINLVGDSYLYIFKGQNKQFQKKRNSRSLTGRVDFLVCRRYPLHRNFGKRCFIFQVIR